MPSQQERGRAAGGGGNNSISSINAFNISLENQLQYRSAAASSQLFQNVSTTSSRQIGLSSSPAVGPTPSGDINNIQMFSMKKNLQPTGSGTLTTAMFDSQPMKPSFGGTESSFIAQTANNNTTTGSARFIRPTSHHQLSQSNIPLVGGASTKTEDTTASHKRALSQVLPMTTQRTSGEGVNSSMIKGISSSSNNNLGQLRSAPKGSVRFAEDDDYCYYIKGSLIDDGKDKGVHHTAQSGGQVKGMPTTAAASAGEKVIVHAKKILKKTRNIDDTESRRSTGLSKNNRFESIMQPSATSIEERTQLQKQKDLNNLLGGIDENNTGGGSGGASGQSDKELIERFISGAMSSGNLRSRSNSTRFNGGGSGDLRHSLTGSKLEQLGDYEKRDYIRRASDRMSMQNVHFLHTFDGERLQRVIQSIGNWLLRVLALKAVVAFRRDETPQLFEVFFNASIIAVLALLYPVCRVILDARAAKDNLGLSDWIISDVKSSSHYAGHLILFVLFLLIVRLSREVRDFQLSQVEKVCFKLVFSEMRWKGMNQKTQVRRQQRTMVEKWGRIDRVMENIEDAEGGEVAMQVGFVVGATAMLLAGNVALLFTVILDDSQLLKAAVDGSGSQQSYFTGRLVVSFVISAMLLADSYAIRMMFWFIKQRMSFVIYEKAQMYLIFAVQMSVMLVYSAKVLSYVNPSYLLNYFRQSNLTDDYQLAYFYLAMAISEITFGLAERGIIGVVEWVRKVREERKRSRGRRQYVRVGQVAPVMSGARISLQVDDLDNGSSKEQPELLQEETTTKTGNGGEGEGEREGEGEERLKQSSCSQFRVMRSAVSAASINYLLLNNAVLCPATMVVAVIANAVMWKVIGGGGSSVISFMDGRQTKSSINMVALLAVMLSAFLTLTLGFSSGQYFTREFAYFDQDSTLLEVVKIITSSELLGAVAVFIAVIALQQRNRYLEAYQTINETIVEMRKEKIPQRS